MNMQSQSLLDEWKKLAQIENKRMRQNMDGCPFGEVPDAMRHGYREWNGIPLSHRIFNMIREEPGIRGKEIMERLGLTKKQWDNSRGVLVRNKRIRTVTRTHNDATWEVVG